MAGKLQNEDHKTEAELVTAGGTKAQLLNDTKIYVTANSINKTLDDAIADGDIGNGLSFLNVAIIEDVQASGVNGGSSTSTVQTRVLNTLTQTSSWASLGSNQITITPTGTQSFLIKFFVPSFRSDDHIAHLYDATGASILKYGQSAFDSSGSSATNALCVGSHVVTLSAANIYEIRDQVTTPKATNGLGDGHSFAGVTNTFTRVEIYELG